MKSNPAHRGSLIKLNREFEERYIILHRHAFPDVLKRIRKSKIRNYSIFLLDRVLFSHLEYVGKDYDSDMKAMAKDETTREWWKLTDPMQEPFPTRNKGEWWAGMRLISHLDEITKPYSKVTRICYTAETHPGSEPIIRELFGRFDRSLASQFKRAHIQNQSVFLGHGRICVYFEYSGRDFPKDDKALNSQPVVNRWNEQIGKKLRVSWKEMKEVFHTN